MKKLGKIHFYAKFVYIELCEIYLCINNFWYRSHDAYVSESRPVPKVANRKHYECKCNSNFVKGKFQYMRTVSYFRNQTKSLSNIKALIFLFLSPSWVTWIKIITSPKRAA